MAAFSSLLREMTDYNREQSEAILMVRECLRGLSASETKDLRKRIRRYLGFRRDVDAFLESHFSHVCTEKCYRGRLSACCSREGITTFFADVVINMLMTSEEDVNRLLRALGSSDQGLKCVYLGEQGCLWKVKPMVCEMFLCSHARETVLAADPQTLKGWEALEARGRRYTWPSRPVLFDELESYFMERGCRSSLMYFHEGPGLLRVKALAAERRRQVRKPAH